MSVSAGQSQLHDALKTLRAQWQETRSDWKDQIAKEFEERYWNNLNAGAVAVMSAMDRLDQVLRQMRSDCAMEGEGIELSE